MKLLRLAAALTGGVTLFIAAWLVMGGRSAVAAPASPLGPAVTITQTISLHPARDNTLYASELGTISNGAGDFLFAGNTQNSLTRRALLAFDLNSIPPGATVLTASLTLTMSKSIAGATNVALHAASANWGEGTSDAVGEEGAGALATPGDATWLHTFYNNEMWANPGGDFAATPSAVTLVGGIGSYTWSSAGLLADVIAWVAEPTDNFGWLLLGDETADGTAKRFDSRESDAANRPRLVITYLDDSEKAYVPVVLR